MGDIANQTMTAIEGKVAVPIKRYWEALAGKGAPELTNQEYKDKAKELVLTGKMILPKVGEVDVAKFRTAIKNFGVDGGLSPDMAQSLSELDSIPTAKQAKELSEAVERGAEKGSSFGSSIGGFFTQIMNFISGFFSGLMEYFSKDNKKSFGDCISGAIRNNVAQTVGRSVHEEVSQLGFVKPHQAKEIAVAAMEQAKKTDEEKKKIDPDQELKDTKVDKDFHKNIRPQIQKMIRAKVEEGFTAPRKDEKGNPIKSVEQEMKDGFVVPVVGIATGVGGFSQGQVDVVKKTISETTYKVISDEAASKDTSALRAKLVSEIQSELKKSPDAKIKGYAETISVEFGKKLDDSLMGMLSSGGKMAQGHSIPTVVSALPNIQRGQGYQVTDDRHDAATSVAPPTPAIQAVQTVRRK